MSQPECPTQVTILRGSMPKLASFAQQHCQTYSWRPGTEPQVRAWSTEAKLAFLREQKVGRYTLMEGPELWRGLHPSFPEGPSLRAMLHLDYTASAQALEFIEAYLQDTLATYANTHTETSATGRSSTQRFHDAIEIIRHHVQAGAGSFVIPSGYGATGAIEKIQKILGLYLSPKGQKTIRQHLGVDLKSEMAKKVVVFVGPYEHHSNDVSWQDDALASFVRIKALRSGPHRTAIDLDDLETQLEQYRDYIKIGSFSAASNVTGLKCQLKPLSDILHKHGALFFVDYAASGPYADINMERDGIDAIFLSVHKNIGGANLGLLVGRPNVYDLSSNPSFGGGGTVAAVTPWEYHFHEAIEEREAAGTPAIRQTWQAALSFRLKEWLGQDLIDAHDRALSSLMLDFFRAHPKLELLGNEDPELRYPIFSFLVKHGDRKLHHNFVAVLLSDFFGIQARSGCACAGPFGHELLGIERELSSQYLELILNVLNGFKPGWTRIGTHYTLSEIEVRYTQKALSAIAWFGSLFLDQYRFDPYSGDWKHDRASSRSSTIDFETALHLGSGKTQPQLDGEASLYACFHNQLEEFYLLAATQLARLIFAERAEDIRADLSIDSLATAIYPKIKYHIESNASSEQGFLHALTASLCPLLAPPGKDWESCRQGVEHLLQGLIFAPQLQPYRFESFSSIDAHLPFFYVAAQKLTQSIRGTFACRPCGPVPSSPDA